MVQHIILITKDHLKMCIIFSTMKDGSSTLHNFDMKFLLQWSVFNLQIMGTTEKKIPSAVWMKRNFGAKTKSSLKFNFIYLVANDIFYIIFL